jgi:hypothetical protein
MTLNLDLVTGQEFLVKLSAVNFVHYTKSSKTIKITTSFKDSNYEDNFTHIIFALAGYTQTKGITYQAVILNPTANQTRGVGTSH